MAKEKPTFTQNFSNVITSLKSPKDKTNKFGGYSFRNAEDILAAVKPILAKNNLILNLTDNIAHIEGRFYVQAVAKVIGDSGSIESSGLAREADHKKGMDDAQLTGSASSYARKYALQGLFCIDDTKMEAPTEIDSMDNRNNNAERIEKSQGMRKVVPPSKAQSDYLMKMLMIKYDKKIPQNILDSIPKLDGPAVSKKIEGLKKELFPEDKK